MKTLQIAAGITLFACSCVAFSQSDVPCGQTLDAPIRASSILTVDSLSSGIEIVGTDKEAIHVSCTADPMDNARRIHLRFSGNPTHSKLTIDGSHPKNSNLHIRVEVPRKMNLKIRMSAGQVNVDEIAGDKDIELYAGQITISSAHKWDYKNVDVSVGIGQVNAQVFDADKGGFFRTFHRENADGEYRLHAHITTGQIDLLGKSAHAASNLE